MEGCHVAVGPKPLIGRRSGTEGTARVARPSTVSGQPKITVARVWLFSHNTQHLSPLAPFLTGKTSPGATDDQLAPTMSRRLLRIGTAIVKRSLRGQAGRAGLRQRCTRRYAATCLEPLLWQQRYLATQLAFHCLRSIPLAHIPASQHRIRS